MVISNTAKKDLHSFARIAVIGISGSGKSIFSRTLAAKTGLPLYHMDCYFWKPGWVEVPAAEWQQQEGQIIAQEKWILEGYIDDGYPARLSRADMVVYLDRPGYVCALNGLKRWWQHRRTARPELPGCPERFNLSFLWTMLVRKERRGIETALRQSHPATIIRIKSMASMRDFLK